MKREIKDSVFTFLFKQPEYTLQLYQTLHPEDTDVTEDDCKIVTLENTVLNDMYNDLGFMVKNLLIILVEAHDNTMREEGRNDAIQRLMKKFHLPLEDVKAAFEDLNMETP